MKRVILFFYILSIPTLGISQALEDINFGNLYDSKAFDFQMEMVRHTNEIKVYYVLATKEPISASDYQINWNRRDTFSQAEGNPAGAHDSTLVEDRSFKKGILTGFSLPEKPWFLVASVTSPTQERWTYVIKIEKNYPVKGIAEGSDGRMNPPYFSSGDQVTFKNFEQKQLHGFYYRQSFTPAFPPFAEEVPPVNQFFIADSTFHFQSGSTLTSLKEGLYLIQEDTLGTEGLAFRVVNGSYPKITRIADLAGPVAYITTQDEYNELLAANGEKSKFDKVVLSITGNTDRASRFIRSYFQRVESANRLFTSYKEGWKTDRGLLYTIFGPPDNVTRDDNIESWYYRNSGARYTFVRTATIYDPHNYVLIRDKKYTETWYSTIDQWRKGRL